MSQPPRVGSAIFRMPGAKGYAAYIINVPKCWFRTLDGISISSHIGLKRFCMLILFNIIDKIRLWYKKYPLMCNTKEDNEETNMSLKFIYQRFF